MNLRKRKILISNETRNEEMSQEMSATSLQNQQQLKDWELVRSYHLFVLKIHLNSRESSRQTQSKLKSISKENFCKKFKKQSTMITLYDFLFLLLEVSCINIFQINNRKIEISFFVDSSLIEHSITRSLCLPFFLVFFIYLFTLSSTEYFALNKNLCVN